MKIYRVFHHLLPFLFFVYCIALLSTSVSADVDNDAFVGYNACFNSNTDYVAQGYDTRPNNPPDNYTPIGLNPDYTYCFCAGRCNNGLAFFTDSPILVITGGNLSCQFSVPDGYHIQGFSFRFQNNRPPYGDTVWSSTSTRGFVANNFSNGTYGYVIFRNDCTIVDSYGNDVDVPLFDENFEFELSAWTDYSVRGYAFTNTENIYRVQFFICPEPDLSSSVDLIADDLFVYLSQLSDITLADSDKERILDAFERQYPLVYEAMETSGEKIVKAVETIKHLAIGVTIPDSPLSGGLEYAVDLINQVRIITDSSYYGYRGFGGGYIGTTGTDFTINVLNFYSNVRNSPNYTDVNRIYAVYYSNTESECPVAVLSSTFRVSDFFPSMTFPPLSVPSPSVIDGQPSTPTGSGTDWTIFQHAMYMQYLLDQLNRDFSVSLKNYGDTLKLPDYSYTYDSTDLVPYDFDVSVPDISAPDGLPLDLVRPVSFLGTLWENILDSTGLSVIIPWCMIIGLVAWFFYGKN